jgi:hypothetical protein
VLIPLSPEVASANIDAMGEHLTTALVSVVLAIISLAALATVLSKQANTSSVIQAASAGLSTDIGAATAPVTGASSSGGLGSLPSLPSLGNGL